MTELTAPQHGNRETPLDWSALNPNGATVCEARERLRAGEALPDDAALVAAAESGARVRAMQAQQATRTPRATLDELIKKVEAEWIQPSTAAELVDVAADCFDDETGELWADPIEVGTATLQAHAHDSTPPIGPSDEATRRAQLRAAEILSRRNNHKLHPRKREILERRRDGATADTHDELVRVAAEAKRNRCKRARDLRAELEAEKYDPAFRLRHERRMVHLGLDPKTRPYPAAIQRMCAEIEGDRSGRSALRHLFEACHLFDGHAVGALRRAALGRYKRGDTPRRDFHDARARGIVAVGLMLLHCSEQAKGRGQWSRCTRGLGRGVLCHAAGRADVPRGDKRRRISLSTLRGHRSPERDDWGYLDALEEAGFLWRQQLYGHLARPGEIGPSGHPTNTYWILGRALRVAAAKLPAYVELCAEGWADSRRDVYGPELEASPPE